MKNILSYINYILNYILYNVYNITKFINLNIKY